MSPAPAKRSALDAFADEEWAAEGVVGLEVVETRFEGYLNLRLDPADGDLAAAAAEVLGTALVTVPNTVVDGLGVTIYWLGPDEWLLRTPSEDDRGLAGKLEARLGGFWHSLIDVSGGMAHLALAGPAARDVLSQGMTLDLHARAFAPGRCAQTLLARANVLIAPVGDDGFDLFVRRSFADHVLRFLRDAASEYGFRLSRAN